MNLNRLSSCSAIGLLLLPAPLAGQCPTEKLVPGDLGFDDDFGFAVAVSGDTALVGAPLHGVPPGEVASSGAVYVFERAGTDWLQTAELHASDAAPGDAFGSDVALQGDRALIGAWGDDELRGAAYVFERTAGVWAQTDKLVAADGEVADGFGLTVALDGDVALVGAFGDDDLGIQSGAAYLFARTPAQGWVQTDKLTSPDGGAFDEFGSDVALGGGTLVVGAERDSEPAFSTGSAYVYVLGVTGPLLQQKLTAASGAANHFFGSAVALEGDTAVIGAPASDTFGPGAGQAHVFQRSGTVWLEVQVLSAGDTPPLAAFGAALALDGDVLLVGAPDDGLLGPEPGSGSAYVFDRVGGVWQQRTKLVAPDAGAFDNFGAAAALSGDDLFVGAPAVALIEFGSGGTEGVYAYSASGTACPPLFAAPASLSVADGGAQQLALQPGAAFAGHLHLLLGSASGTLPGVVVGGVTLPLNPDAYLLFVLQSPGAPPLSGAVGNIDAAGTAQAAFSLPAGSPPFLAGLGLHHAYLLFDPVALAPSLASNPEPLLLTP